MFVARAPYLATLVIGATEATEITEGMKSRPAGCESKVLKVLKFVCIHFERLPCPGAAGSVGRQARPGRCCSRDYRHGETRGQGASRNWVLETRD